MTRYVCLFPDINQLGIHNYRRLHQVLPLFLLTSAGVLSQLQAVSGRLLLGFLTEAAISLLPL